MIPEDWEILKLAEIAKVVDSLHQTPNFSQDGYPMVRVADIKTGNLNLRGALMVDEAIFAEFTRNYRPKRNDIVLSRVGSYGVSSFVETDELFCLGQNTVVLQSKLPPRFLYYALNSRQIRLQIENGSYGSGYKALSLRNIQDLVITLPPTQAEQQAIAEALSDADAFIESLEQLIDKKRLVKQGAMQELLTGKRRLPGFSGEWATWTFGQLFDLLRTANNSRSELAEEGDIGYLHYGDVHTHATAFFDFTTDLRTFIPRAKVSTIPRLADGDLVMADASEDTVAIGKAVEVRGLNGREAVAGLHTMLLHPRKGVLADGFKGYLQYFPSVRAALVRLATGVSVYGVTKFGVKAIEVTIPKPVEQTAIAAILSDMDEEIAALEDKLAKARQIKQGMMQELLTGRIRLV